MTTTLDKINKTNGNKFDENDIAIIDNNATKIENALNNLPSSGSVVTSSTTNGNIKIDGNETTVYTHPTGSTTTNPHGTTKTDVGLGNVNNTSDLNKPISTATQNALNSKATVVALTATEYLAIQSPVATTLYLIKA